MIPVVSKTPVSSPARAGFFIPAFMAKIFAENRPAMRVNFHD